MATQLDLQEQEQLDALKSFWKQYGNLITWLLVLLLGAYAAWIGWNYYQRDQASKAAALYDELDRSAQAGDAQRAARVFDDLKARYGGTTFAAQGGLLAAKVMTDKNELEPAGAALSWVAAESGDEALKSVARLRLAALLLQQGKPQDALKQLEAPPAPGFEALFADRRGDILMAEGKKAEARAAYEAAYRAMDAQLDYRRLIEAKLTAIGVAPAASGATP
jgi:predicted negative regulator of RcsB-dependent stress response